MGYGSNSSVSFHMIVKQILGDKGWKDLLILQLTAVNLGNAPANNRNSGMCFLAGSLTALYCSYASSPFSSKLLHHPHCDIHTLSQCMTGYD